MIPSKAEINRHVTRVLNAAREQSGPRHPAIPDHVTASWRRSIETYGLDPARVGRPRVLEHGAICERRDRLERLLQAARSSMSELHSRVHDSGYCVLMTDGDGATIDFRGVPSIDRDLQTFGMRAGTCWSEQDEGTGAIGIALAERVPIMVHKTQHFRAHNISMSCNAAPIFGPDDSLLAILNATAFNGSDRHDSQLVHQLVARSATLIENAFFADQYKDRWMLSIGDSDSFTESRGEQLIAFEEPGLIVAANRAARDPAPRGESLEALDLEALFDRSGQDLIRLAHRHPGWTIPLRCNRTGRQLYARIRAPERRPPTARQPARTTLRLGDLTVADERLIQTVQRLQRIVDRKIPILLLGETGSGKEVFARAIHQHSTRRGKPFVALNCAALPEGLIESELFGYQGGAFTGARAQGEKGKIQLAAGGTLFLDEIGDMPLPLQTRLLRVLSEGELLPLGASQPARVDLNVVCATHRDLSDLVARGQFRQDLFFRLNAATFHLPPLRERTDRRELIERIFEEECARQERLCLVLPEETIQHLMPLQWPGNVRQLRNAISYAVALCEDTALLGLEQFPADILAAAAGRRPAGRSADRTPLGGAGRVAGAARRAKAQAAEERERAEIVAVLQRNHWHMSRAAQQLGISRATLYRKLRRYDIVSAGLS